MTLRARSLVVILVIAAVLGVALLSVNLGSRPNSTKPVILYVNQGNGVVDESNFGAMIAFSKAHAFNIIFFQVYRSGNLLFGSDILRRFVQEAHNQSLKIFFALYFTDSSQQLPTLAYYAGEDGISLDMSTLPTSSQTNLFEGLHAAYGSGETAITTTNASIALRPNLLVLETYGGQNQGFIRHGIVASVGVFATADRQDYEDQVGYALGHSDGVMVFDYAALLKHGY